MIEGASQRTVNNGDVAIAVVQAGDPAAPTVVLEQIADREARAAAELEAARRIQDRIVPTVPALAQLEVLCHLRPADVVGGDYLDIYDTEDASWVLLGDVTGHGLGAGLVMLMVQSATMAVLRQRPFMTPREAVIHVNQVLYENVRKRLGSDDFVTYSLLRYSRNGAVMFAGAHEDVLLWRRARGVVEAIPMRGTWLGAMPDVSRATVNGEMRLEDGDELLRFGAVSVALTTALWDHRARAALLQRAAATARDAGSLQVLDTALWILSLAELSGGTPRRAGE